MEKLNINTLAFFTLLQAGLWPETEKKISVNEVVDWNEVYQLAQEQSVQGLVLQGIDWFKVQGSKFNIPQVLLMQWIGEVQVIEQQNKAMNNFIGQLVERLRSYGIYTLLVKGSGIAQCYERPLWRSCGDVDLYLSDDNYQKAKELLMPIADSVAPEGVYEKHLRLNVDNWTVELHGYLRCGLSTRMDRGLDELHHEVFCGGDVRSWMNGKTLVFIPGVNCDVIFVFTHFLKHFYLGGLGIRQLCDWSRLLWTYKDMLNQRLLESRLHKMGLLSEWRAFGAFAVEYLGMPSDAMPLYSPDVKWKGKADKICAFIMEVGNMGHNRDSSYFHKYPYVIRKVCSFGRRVSDLYRHACIFPLDSIRFLPRIMYNGVRSMIRGE